jgi:hypothetical protein
LREAAAKTVTVPESFVDEDAEGESEAPAGVSEEDEEEQALSVSSTAVPPTASCRVRRRAERIITGSLPICRARCADSRFFHDLSGTCPCDDHSVASASTESVVTLHKPNGSRKAHRLCLPPSKSMPRVKHLRAGIAWMDGICATLIIFCLAHTA